MKCPPPFSVNHDVRFPSNRDGVSLSASVYTPSFDASSEDDSAKRRQKENENEGNARSERRSEARGGDASGSEDASLSGHGVVIIHAHPKFGGAPEMMRALAAELASHGIRVVNLALRGAGASGGSTSWQGDGGEVADVVTAADYARETLRCRYVHLVGYSFGATVAGAAVDARDFISTYVAVAYPLGHWWSRGIFGFGAKLLMHRHTDPLKESVKPKLFVIGTEDDFTSRGATERFARRCCAPWDVRVYEDADHFAFVADPFVRRVGSDIRRFIRKYRAYVDVSAPEQTSASAEEVVEDDVWSDMYADLMSPKKRDAG